MSCPRAPYCGKEGTCMDCSLAADQVKLDQLDDMRTPVQKSLDEKLREEDLVRMMEDGMSSRGAGEQEIERFKRLLVMGEWLEKNSAVVHTGLRAIRSALDIGSANHALRELEELEKK